MVLPGHRRWSLRLDEGNVEAPTTKWKTSEVLCRLLLLKAVYDDVRGRLCMSVGDNKVVLEALPGVGSV